MQLLPGVDFRPRKSKLFTELSTGALCEKWSIESTRFRTTPEPVSTPAGEVRIALRLAPPAMPR